jgi:multiple sugar transport system substrate-binding protein
VRTRVLAAVAVTAATALTATACGAGSSGDGKSIKVAYWQHLNASNKQQTAFLKDKVTAFKKAHPGTSVKLIPITASEKDYSTKIQLMMRSPSTAPDLVMEDTAFIHSDIASGYLKPLDSYVHSWSGWKQYVAASKKAVTESGKVYGIPSDTDTRGIWYNKDILRKAGVPVPFQPHSWADILNAAKKVKAKAPGVVPLNIYTGTAGGEQSTMQGLEMLLYGTPAGDNCLYNASKKKWVVGSQGFKDALTFLKTVYSQGLGPSKSKALGANIGTQVATDMLPSGKLAMDIDGSWLPQHWLSTGDKPWKDWTTTMGTVAMPTQHGQGSGKVSMSGGWAWAVPAHAKNPDLAWKFQTLLQTKANATEWATSNAYIAPRKDVAKDPKYLKAVPTNKFFTSLLADTHYRPGLPKYNQVSTAIQRAMESVTTGGSVDAAAHKYDQDVKSAVGDKNVIKAGK